MRQDNHSEAEALRNEFSHGLATLASGETVAGKICIIQQDVVAAVRGALQQMRIARGVMGMQIDQVERHWDRAHLQQGFAETGRSATPAARVTQGFHRIQSGLRRINVALVPPNPKEFDMTV